MWYAVKYHPTGVKLFLLCTAPMLCVCLIALTCEDGSNEELIWTSVFAVVQIIWLPILIFIEGRYEKTGKLQKIINERRDETVSSWQSQLAKLGYKHPTEVVELLLGPDSPAAGGGRFDLIFAEKWLRTKYKNQLTQMSDGELEKKIGIAFNDLPDYEFPYEYKINGETHVGYIDWKHDDRCIKINQTRKREAVKYLILIKDGFKLSDGDEIKYIGCGEPFNTREFAKIVHVTYPYDDEYVNRIKELIARYAPK